MKKLLTSFLITVTIAISCTEKSPVYVEYYKQGEILYPDYACPDTMIVIDAVGLNTAFGYVEQDISWGSDADIDSLIHIYCKHYTAECPVKTR